MNSAKPVVGAEMKGFPDVRLISIAEIGRESTDMGSRW